MTSPSFNMITAGIPGPPAVNPAAGAGNSFSEKTHNHLGVDTVAEIVRVIHIISRQV